jgi:3-hydroxyacyl-CoA dehydrogenase/enoyl-CoA hydratase/3-hydroxybutyryl-CoA epimerase
MAIQYAIDADKIVTLTIDMAGRSMNVINEEFGAAMADAMARLEQEPEVRGIIITSGKDSFVAGADIEMLWKLTTAEQAFQAVEEFKKHLRKLEKMGKPLVAALTGTALGGGLEIALACHHRICINNPKAKLGLPEVKLGILPAGGGVTRLVRILGLQEAFPYLAEGKEISPEKAKAIGIIHELASDVDDLMAKAKAWIKENPVSKAPWDQDGFKLPGGAPTHPMVAQMLAIAPAVLRKKTYHNYPAPEAILAAAVEGAHADFETASRIESRYFAGLASGKVARNMIGTFWFQLNQIKAGASRPEGVSQNPVKKLGVLGAGMMGHGIAHVSALAGIEVVLKDATLERAQEGRAKCEALLKKAVGRGRMTQEKADQVLGRIVATGGAEDLKGCDLIIEAVFEDRDLKAKVSVEAETQIAGDAVFASNTSTLPITGLAKPVSRPQNFIGIHFFSPVEKMPLVEIIRGEQTSDYALAKAFDYVLQIKKTPIVVNDSRGFYTSRVFATYVQEGLAMLSEGQHPRAIESAGLQAGMPVGPLVLADEVSLNLMKHIRDQTKKDYEAEGKPFPAHPFHAVLDKMVSLDRLGKAHGKGFYEYEGGEKHLWPGLQEHFPLAAEQLPQQDLIDRILFIQSIETVRCMEEGVFTSVADANIGSIFGWGFAPYTGGTIQFINHYGVQKFVERARALEAKYGARFAVPQKLVSMAEAGESFPQR